jgi:hypothetical protein
MNLENRKSKIENGNWLPDMDSNHDKLLQRQLCYRYTIGQTGPNRLPNLPRPSSRHTPLGDLPVSGPAFSRFSNLTI